FLAGEEFLDHELRPRIAEAPPFHELPHRVPRLTWIFGDDDTLAGSQSVGLDDNRVLRILKRTKGFAGRCAFHAAGGRNLVRFEKCLRETLARLEARLVRGRADGGEIILSKQVNHALTQRRFRSDEG